MLENETSLKYVLVRTSNYGEKIKYISDFLVLIENKDVFIITNSKGCYFTTCDGWFDLYKNGDKIDGEIFDTDPGFTTKINYGTLEQAFKQVTTEGLEKVLNE